MGILNKLQNLPTNQRKLILLALIVIIGMGLLNLYIKNIRHRLKGFEVGEFQEKLKFPELQEELKGLPKIEMPKLDMSEMDEEKLKELEKMMEEATSTP